MSVLHHAGSAHPDDVIIKVMSVVKVPKEHLSDSDPYVKLSLVSAEGGRVGISKQTIHFEKCENPVWNTFLNLRATSDRLKVELWDYDHVTRNDKYGEIIVPMTELPFDTPKTFPFKSNSEMAITLQRVSQQPLKKTIYIMRHAESKWNAAQSKMDVQKMYQQVDHPLSDLGLSQAAKFNAKWKQALKDGTLTDREQKFLSQDLKPYASPLTRTVQTALLMLQDHPAVVKEGITFLRNMREVKSLGGVDTCGKEVGDGIMKRVKTEFLENKDTAMIVDGLVSPAIILNDAVQEWWSGKLDKDNETEMLERYHDWLATVLHDSNNGGLYVGHSHYFLGFLKKFVAKEYKGTQMAIQMTKFKMENASCLSVDIEFKNGRPEVVYCESLFGTGFITGAPKKDGE